MNFQALCGTILDVPTLTGEKIPINLTNEIVKPTTVKRLQGHGLPFPKEPSRKGDLLVAFDIKFPETLSASVKDILYDTLPNWRSTRAYESAITLSRKNPVLERILELHIRNCKQRLQSGFAMLCTVCAKFSDPTSAKWSVRLWFCSLESNLRSVLLLKDWETCQSKFLVVGPKYCYRRNSVS